jgi:hypothetical protein
MADSICNSDPSISTSLSSFNALQRERKKKKIRKMNKKLEERKRQPVWCGSSWSSSIVSRITLYSIVEEGVKN